MQEAPTDLHDIA